MIVVAAILALGVPMLVVLFVLLDRIDRAHLQALAEWRKQQGRLSAPRWRVKEWAPDPNPPDFVEISARQQAKANLADWKAGR